MKKTPFKERLDRWIEYAEFANIPLTRLLVHPDDFNNTNLRRYRGLPIVCMKEF